ncbi:class I SAM-dependent methyltransferase [Lusitaniella coriacea LEGE 07157]|uniref:Class I SAM-dependent methyltransferase n=2 Tax=Lusitaniella TaxID=1983104 RepID=A0A8J7AXB8_9CYAN|nr:class I SAM-dependent methyltransferase [Lusitaniella coriacea LEGE 07157]
MLKKVILPERQLEEDIDLAERPDINIASAWENYWSKTYNLSNPILWDSNAEKAAALDLPRFKDLMSPQLPLIDMACGNGTQTRFLADHFPRLIGVDVAQSAVEMAQKHNSAPNIEYRTLDALKPEQATALHVEIGDANIYMRTGFHHISPEHRDRFAQSLKILLGKTGILYLIELGAGATDYLNSLIELYGEPPRELALVIEHGIRPGDITEEKIKDFFPDCEILDSGEDFLYSDADLQLLEGGFKIPTFYAVIKHK